jgi:transcriptional repressor NrdR
MICPFCEHSESKVLETRDVPDVASTRRRRECLACEKRYTTYERIETEPLLVRKKGGRIENFDRAKLKGGLLKAAEKTTVTHEQIERILDKVERKLRREKEVEIESRKIGDLAAKELKKLDKVAYIRFSSVFKRFVDLEEFEKELKKLL